MHTHHTHTHAHMHTHHTHTHARTHARTRTHTHTHTKLVPDVHRVTDGADLNDLLSEKDVALFGQSVGYGCQGTVPLIPRGRKFFKLIQRFAESLQQEL